MSQRSPETTASMRLLLEMWDEIVSRDAPVTLRMRGSSMWPAVPDQSVLSVAPCASGALQRGDLATFRSGEVLITHRVVRVHEGGDLTTWGDSVLRPDPRIAAGDVLGKATVLERAPALGRGFHRGVALRWALANVHRVIAIAR